MSRKVFVHVGAPKTGTTYLQGMLDANHRELFDHGIQVPYRHLASTPSVFHFRAALDVLGQDWGGPPGHAEGCWDAMVRKVRRKSDVSIWSHEILAPAHAEVVERVRRELCGRNTEFHVVYTARDPSRLLPAAWQESIKQGRQWTYAQFLKRTKRGRTWFGRAFDLPKVLSTWGAGLPPERIHLITVPKRTADHQPRPDELWLRFCEVVGMDPSWAVNQTDTDNRSLGIPETNVLRRLNKRMDSPVRRPAPYDRLIKQLLAQEELVGRPSNKVELPPRMFPWVTEMAERWAEWVEASGIDVVGDVADLLPGEAPPPKQWVNPDKPGNAATLDAALDALVAMTREAARRGEPERSLTSKVKEGARRVAGS